MRATIARAAPARAPTFVPAADPPKRGEFHIPSLDGIRAASFLLVFLFHAAPTNSPIPGTFGVTVFFFLSGYLITTLLRMEFDRRGTISLKRFYQRRALRILPPFYLVLVAALLLAKASVIAGGLQASGVRAMVLHYANYRLIREGWAGIPQGSGVYWSLAVEEHFYLLFPCLYLLLRRTLAEPKHQAMVLWVMCAALLAWRGVLVYGLHSDYTRILVATDTRVDSILFGCALAVFGNPQLDGPSRFSPKTWKWVFFPTALVLLLFTFLFRNDPVRETFRYTLQGIALYPIFIVAMRHPDWGVFRVFNLHWMKFLGVLSYSLYLLHEIVIRGIQYRVPIHPLLQGALALAISIILAWVIYERIEKPCARLRKRLSGFGRASARAAVAT